MDPRPSISIDRLISAAKFIEQATSVLQQNPFKENGEDCRHSPGGKQRVLTRRAYMKASTSASDCLDSRSSASASPTSTNMASPYAGANSSRHSRAAHNELEKTRRANLRGYLDKLKDIVPASCDSTRYRYTTLSLLTQARDYIMDLQERTCKAEADKSRLKERRAELQALIEKARSGIENLGRPESASTISAIDENERCPTSPIYLEYSPSAKPSDGGSPVSASMCTPPVDPYLDGLLPALPLFYPRISLYPYLDVKTHPVVPSSNSSLLPVESAVL
ncbi:Max dimerization protein 3 [Toxocara canis]|nr:Max dimerization protein 3 [Toxocara canis]